MTINDKRLRRLSIAVWITSVGSVLALSVQPVNSGSSRAALLVAVGATFVLPLVIWWRDRFVRATVLACVILPCLLLVLPGRSTSPIALREALVRELRGFEGTRYVWGGEGRLGIDCSGLVRQSLIRASLKSGLASFDGRLLRAAVSLWWHDASALAMRDGYRAQTKVLFEAPSINAVVAERLAPGDFAVTSNGVHVLAYLGDGKWIEADPDFGEVVVMEVPASNRWFRMPVHVITWSTLAE